jgi:hypothetical protein
MQLMGSSAGGCQVTCWSIGRARMLLDDKVVISSSSDVQLGRHGWLLLL